MRLLAMVAGALLCAVPATSLGQTVLFADDFESYPADSPLYEWGYTAPSVYTASDVRSYGGSRSGHRDLADSSSVGTQTALRDINYTPTTPQNSVLIISAMIYMGSGQASNTTAGLVAYDGDGDLIGQATILSSGRVNLTAPGYNRTSTDVVANLDDWNSLTLVIDLYLSRTWLTINGSLIDTLDVPFPANRDDLGTVGLLSRRGSGESQADVYWDDLSVEAVPEPASMLALAAGAGWLLRRRRR